MSTNTDVVMRKPATGLQKGSIKSANLVDGFRKGWLRDTFFAHVNSEKEFGIDADILKSEAFRVQICALNDYLLSDIDPRLHLEDPRIPNKRNPLFNPMVAYQLCYDVLKNDLDEYLEKSIYCRPEFDDPPGQAFKMAKMFLEVLKLACDDYKTKQFPFGANYEKAIKGTFYAFMKASLKGATEQKPLGPLTLTIRASKDDKDPQIKYFCGGVLHRNQKEGFAVDGHGIQEYWEDGKRLPDAFKESMAAAEMMRVAIDTNVDSNSVILRKRTDREPI